MLDPQMRIHLDGSVLNILYLVNFFKSCAVSADILRYFPQKYIWHLMESLMLRMNGDGNKLLTIQKQKEQAGTELDKFRKVKGEV